MLSMKTSRGHSEGRSEVREGVLEHTYIRAPAALWFIFVISLNILQTLISKSCAFGAGGGVMKGVETPGVKLALQEFSFGAFFFLSIRK